MSQRRRAKPDAVAASIASSPGTINGAGAIEIEVTRRLRRKRARQGREDGERGRDAEVADPALHRPVRAHLRARGAGRSSFVLLFAWVVVDEPFRDSFYRAMAVLVAASPCALAIATPSAVLSGVARAARGGVLVKGGAPLENLGSLKAHRLRQDRHADRRQAADHRRRAGRRRRAKRICWRVAVAVESLSDHPLAARDRAATDASGLAGAPMPAATRSREPDRTRRHGDASTARRSGSARPRCSARRASARWTPRRSMPIATLREGGRTTMVVPQGRPAILARSA